MPGCPTGQSGRVELLPTVGLSITTTMTAFPPSAPDAVTPVTPNTTARSQAKQALRQALHDHGGDPKHAAVAAAINQLVALNPTPVPARSPLLHDAQWRLISAPSFPDGQRQPDGTYVYTLGRLAFEMFPPQDLPVAIQQVSQPVVQIADTNQLTHDIVVEFVTRGDRVNPPLHGIVRNLGVCEPGSDTALAVRFTGGELEPAAGTDRDQWRSVFGQPDSTRRFSLKTWFQRLVLKLIFGLGQLEPLEREGADTGGWQFRMARSPQGSLKILYLDEELRITCGEKGTVLVCDRAVEP